MARIPSPLAAADSGNQSGLLVMVNPSADGPIVRPGVANHAGTTIMAAVVAAAPSSQAPAAKNAVVQPKKNKRRRCRFSVRRRN